MLTRYNSAVRRLILLLAITVTACNPPAPDEGDYVGLLTAARAAKDDEFQRTNDPVPESRKSVLLPLEYYPIDSAFNVPAVLRPALDAPTVKMITSTGTMEEHRATLHIRTFLSHLFFPFSVL